MNVRKIEIFELIRKGEEEKDRGRYHKKRNEWAKQTYIKKIMFGGEKISEKRGRSREREVNLCSAGRVRKNKVKEDAKVKGINWHNRHL